MRSFIIGMVILLHGLISVAQIVLTPTPPEPINYQDGNTVNCSSITPYSIANNGDIISSQYFPNNLNCGVPGYYTSSTSITLKKGFLAASCTGGSFTASIASPVLIHPDPARYLNDVNETYAMFEFGLNIPSSLENQINTYLSNPIYPQPAGSVNPYDPQQILVSAVFISPSNNTYNRYGFFYEDVQENTDAAPQPWVVTPSSYPFRIRFAPPVVGTWTVTISMSLPSQPGSPQIMLFTGQFNVAADNVANSGNIIVGNYWHFKFDNKRSPGGPGFYPVGQDVAWPDENKDNPPDICTWNSEPNEAGPDEFNLQRGYISDMAIHNGNFTRILPNNQFGYEIECGEPTTPTFGYTVTPVTNTSPMPNNYRQEQAYELDKTLNQCEREGIYVLMQNFNDEDFTMWNGYAPPDQSNFGFNWQSGSEPYYNFLFNKYNGASNSDLVGDFFTDAQAIQFVKNRIFYQIARWGYSTNIFGWELMGETDEIGQEQISGNNTTVYAQNPNSFMVHLSQWENTMITYLHSFYPNHIVTTGYAGGPSGWGVHSGAPGFDGSPNMVDFLDSHCYYDYYLPSNPPDGGYDDQMPIYFGYEYGEVSMRNNLNNKPYLFGETGLADATDVYYVSADPFSFYLWAGCFASSGVGLNWWDWQQNHPIAPIEQRTDFNGIGNFMMNIDFENNAFAIIPQFQSIPFATGEACDYYSLVDANAVYNFNLNYSNIDFEIGWIHNTTENWTNTIENSSQDPNPCLTCPPCPNLSLQNFGYWYPSFVSPTTSLIATSSGVEFNGLIAATTYTVSYYDMNDNQVGTSIFTTSSTSYTDNSIQLNSSLPDVAFVLNNGQMQNGNEDAKKAIKFRKSFTDSTSGEVGRVGSDALILSPNPAIQSFSIHLQNGGNIDELTVVDMIGRVCITEVSPRTNIIDVSNLSAGIYFVRVISGARQFNAKLIKE